MSKVSSDLMQCTKNIQQLVQTSILIGQQRFHECWYNNTGTSGFMHHSASQEWGITYSHQIRYCFGTQRVCVAAGFCFGVRSPGNMMWTAAKLNWSQHQTEVLKFESCAAVQQVVSLKTNRKHCALTAAVDLMLSFLIANNNKSSAVAEPFVSV